MKQNHKLSLDLNSKERKLLVSLRTPSLIQAFLDRIPYRAASDYLCPASVLKQRAAHCFDGSIFAAAALRQLGYPPLVLYLDAHNDDPHLLALFRRNGGWGAVSKSNFATLGFREPVYRTIRELVMSYFDFYYNLRGEKSLRSYTGPLNLSRFDRTGWMIRDEAIDAISDRLDQMRIVPLINRSMIRQLTAVGRRAYAAGLIDANPEGLYQPE